MEVVTYDFGQTLEFGEKFAKKLKGGDVVALVGDLGAGKTTFIQGIAKGLGVKQKVISPTFILMRQYEIKNFKNGIKNLYHIDLYRLEGAVESELVNLGIKEILEDKENITLVEWADKAKGIFPKETIWIKFEALDNNKRKITIS